MTGRANGPALRRSWVSLAHAPLSRVRPWSAPGPSRGDLVVLALLVLFAWLGHQDPRRDSRTDGGRARGSRTPGRAIAATTRNTAGAIEGAFAGRGGRGGGAAAVRRQIAGRCATPRATPSRCARRGDEQGGEDRAARRGGGASHRDGRELDRLAHVHAARDAAVLGGAGPGAAWCGMETAGRTMRGAPEHVLAARAASAWPTRRCAATRAIRSGTSPKAATTSSSRPLGAG